MDQFIRCALGLVDYTGHVIERSRTIYFILFGCCRMCMCAKVVEQANGLNCQMITKQTGGLEVFETRFKRLLSTVPKSFFGMAVMPFLCRGVWFSPKLSYHRIISWAVYLPIFYFSFCQKKQICICINGLGCLCYCLLFPLIFTTI